MSQLGRKYNISEESIKQMIKDGIISCSWEKYEEIWKEYQNLVTAGATYGDGVVLDVANKTNVSKQLVYKVISKLR